MHNKLMTNDDSEMTKSADFRRHSTSRADLERSSVGVHHSPVSFSFSRVEHADIMATVRPQIHPEAVSLISEEPAVVCLQKHTRFVTTRDHSLKLQKRD